MPHEGVTEASKLETLLRTKSRDAFSVLYDNYSGALYGIICRIVNNKTTAEDLLQDVFVKIWKSIDSYDSGKGTLFTWMLNIARNTSIDYLRSRQYKQQKASADGLDEIETASEKQQAVYFSDTAELGRLTQKLDEKYRQVIDMVYFLGYSQEEVSQILSVPLGTVKTRCRSGLQQLRNLNKM